MGDRAPRDVARDLPPGLLCKLATARLTGRVVVLDADEYRLLREHVGKLAADVGSLCAVLSLPETCAQMKSAGEAHEYVENLPAYDWPTTAPGGD